MLSELSSLNPDVVILGGTEDILARCRICQEVRTLCPTAKVLTLSDKQKDDDLYEIIMAGASGDVLKSSGSNVVQVELLLPEGTTRPSKSTLIPAMRQQMGLESELQGRSALLETSDLELTVLHGSGPFITFLHSRGGNWLRKGNKRECTSGWSVDGPKGPGIITAGHCENLDKFEQPGVAPYSMRFRSEVTNYHGEVEYHTTSHVELAEFYATASRIRDVDDIKATDSMVGLNVCFYGRASDDRTCNIEVIAVGATVHTDEGYRFGNMAITDSTPSTKGDSGGGWSYGYVAWGVHSGTTSQGYGAFTPVEEAQDALNVTIRTQ